MESNTCKIFVGNVPFQCTQNEFSKCFESIPGFIKAEIIIGPNINTSRGFGFVTFDSRISAFGLLQNTTNIECKDRTLRFTEYNSVNNKHNLLIKNKKEVFNDVKTNNNKYFISVNGITNDMTRDTIKKMFEKYGLMGRYFIVSDHDTGIPKGHAVIEFLSNAPYEYLIKKKEIDVQYLGINYKLQLSKWKQNVNNPTKQ